MTYKAMEDRVCQDLGVSKKIARKYILIFRGLYGGRKEAIRDISAEFTDEGMVCIKYTIPYKKETKEIIF